MLATLDDRHIDLMLETHNVAHLACSENNQPYVVPVTYVFHEGVIYGHMNSGKKLKIMRQNPKVCLEVAEIDAMNSWRSVVVEGDFEELQGKDAAIALDLMIQHLSPADASQTSMSNVLRQDVSAEEKIRLTPIKGAFYRIKPKKKSGRLERPDR